MPKKHKKIQEPKDIESEEEEEEEQNYVPEEEEEEEEEEKYHVEVIKKAKVNAEADWEYLVKWAGYGSDADSWEPQRNVKECSRLLASFWDEVGMDDEDYQVGYEVKPSAAWIKKERRFFHNNFGKDLEKDEGKSKSSAGPSTAKAVVVGKAVKTKGKTRKPGWAWVSASESEAEPSPKVNKQPKKRTKKRFVRDSSSGSESDQPLRKVARTASSSTAPSKPTAQDKGKAKALPTQQQQERAPPAAPRRDDVASLFSAPSSPIERSSNKNPPARANSSAQPIPRKDGVSKAPARSASHSASPAPVAPSRPQPAASSASKQATPPIAKSNVPLASKPTVPLPSKSTVPLASKPAVPPAPRPLAQSHKDKRPKVKAIDIPTTNTGHAISTKARIASGSIGHKPQLTLDTTDVLQNQQRAALKGLSFKKKPSAVAGPSSATADPRKRPLFAPEKEGMVESPGAMSASTHSPAVASGWGDASGGWGQPSTSNAESHQSPTVPAAGGGWGSSTGAGWGADTSNAWDQPSTSNAEAHQSPTVASTWGTDAGNTWGSNASTAWGTSGGDAWGASNSAWGEPAGQAKQPAAPAVPAPRSEATSKPAQPRRVIPPLPRRTGSGQVRQSPTVASNGVSEQAVNQFLASAMPPELAAPMHEPDGMEDIPVAAPPKIPKAPKALLAKQSVFEQMNNTWKWDAELYIEKGSRTAERVCNITMSEATSPVPQSLRLSIIYRPENSILRWEKFHNVSDFPILFRACKEVSQFCKLTHKDEADAESLLMLNKYMIRNQQFTYSHVLLDQDPVGILIVYPSAMVDVSNYYQAPPAMLEKGNWFVAMLVPWAVYAKDYKENCWFPTRKDLYVQGGRLDPELKEKLKAAPRPSRSALFALGLRIHRFTASTYDFLARHPRDYCIWYTQGDGTTERPGFETQALLAVLKACKAKDVGYKSDVRVIFVHVGALKTFNTLVALGMRRSKRPEVRIYAYGTHETVPPDRWGLREIYPIGGIVTFTPLALAQDPWGVYDTIAKVHEHPLWECFIHPCVVSAAARIVHREPDLLQFLDKGGFFFDRLLQLIEDGKVSLLCAPPSKRFEISNGSSKIDARMEWATWLGSLSSLDKKGILTECIRQLDKEFDGTPVKELPTVVERQVMHEFCQLQCQPYIMDNYRRFVLIKEARNDNSECKDGVEMSTNLSFSFKDDYYYKP